MGVLKYLALGVFVSLPLFSAGQEQLEYSGPLKVGKFEGEAKYAYFLSDNDTVLNGAFNMQRSSLEALLENEDVSFSFNGAFKDNYPEGPWTFQFGEFQSDDKTQVVDFQYQLKVSGIQQEASGEIRRGKPNGTWTHIINQIKESEIEQTLFKSLISFSDGVPQQSFRIENKNSTLVGRFLRNGLAHDVWTLYSVNDTVASENWYFDEGRLDKIEREAAGRLQAAQVYEQKDGPSRIITIDSSYIQILKLKLESQANGLIFESSVTQLLAENAGYYQKIDGILSELGESEFLPKFKARVDYFPLDSLEITQLDSIKSLYQTGAQISQSFLNNTQLNILRLSDKEADHFYQAINKISEQFTEPLSDLVSYHEQGIVPFVDRTTLIKTLWPNGLPSVALDLGEGQIYKGPEADDFNFQGNTIEALYQVALYATNSLESIEDVLSKKLTKDQRQQDLIVLEEQLIAKSKDIKQFIEAVKDSTAKAERDALKNIDLLTDSKLSDYAALEDTSGKIDFAKETVICFKQLEKLAQSVSDLQRRRDTIHERYQDAVWNPFIATIMNEEVKKRITTAYDKVLLPYLLEQTTSQLNCGNAQYLRNSMDEAYRRILELRDENTSKLERKLRKEQDPEVVLQLFDLPTLKKEE